MITPLPEYGDIEHGVVRNITSLGTIRDTVSISGVGEQGLFVRHLLVENIRAYDSKLRGPVEVSDGSEYITVRDVYAESCRYGVDVQDHNEEGQVTRPIIIDGLHVKNTRMAVRTANRDFGHDDLTIRNVTGTDWPDDAEEPFQVRNTSNVLIDNVTISGDAQPQFGVVYRVSANETFGGLRIRNVVAPDVRETGIVLENSSDSGQLESYELSGNIATVRTEHAPQPGPDKN